MVEQLEDLGERERERLQYALKYPLAIFFKSVFVYMESNIWTFLGPKKFPSKNQTRLL